MADLKTFNGLARANVKTFGTLASANWKTWNGLSTATAGYTLYAENTSAINNRYQVGINADNYYSGQLAYAPAANITVRRLTFYLSVTGSISGNTYKAEIWNYSTNLTSLVEASTGVAGDNGWSDTEVNFDFVGAAMLSSGSYGLVLTKNAAADGSNYLRFGLTSAGGLSGIWGQFNSSGTRTAFDTIDAKIKIWT